jgi:hypothetical protein
VGRPKKELAFPVAKIKELASYGCTDSEIASVCEIDESNLLRRFAPLLKQGREGFKSEIRKMQWKRMREGSDTMLVWLGKVVLGQKESTEIRLDATDTLAAFVNSIREAAPGETPASVRQVEGQTLPAREYLPN